MKTVKQKKQAYQEALEKKNNSTKEKLFNAFSFKKKKVFTKENVQTIGDLCELFECKLPKNLKAIENDPITSFSFNYANVKSDEIFFAIGTGEFFKRRVVMAREANAKVIFADIAELERYQIECEGTQIIPVEDAVNTYGRYFDLYRDEYEGYVICMTGTIGKTTTKHLITSILGKGDNVFVQDGNWNSPDHISRSMVKSISPDIKYYIQEAGAGAIDTVKMCSRLMKPTVSIITNIKAHHLLGYGSIENIFKDKVSLSDYTQEYGYTVVNFDDEMLANHTYNGDVLSVGIHTDKDVDFRATNIKQNGPILEFDVEFEGRTVPVSIPIVGEHNVYNALYAFATAKALGFKDSTICSRLARFKTSGIRQNVVQIGSNTLYMDCYNVCNDSIVAALKAASQLNPGENGKRIAVIGGENKLGTRRKEVTAELGDMVDLDVLKEYEEIICFGTPETDNFSLDMYGDAQTIYDVLTAKGVDNLKLITSYEDFVHYLKTNVNKNDLVLLKCILWLNASAAVDETFGSNFSVSQDFIKEKSEQVKEGSYEGRIIFNMDQAYLTKCSDNGDKVSIPTTFGGHEVFGIAKGMFRGKTEVKEVDFGQSIKMLDNQSFRGCTGIKSLELPDSLVSVMNNVFRECTGLETVRFGKNIRHIGVNAFKGCDSLKKVILPATVEYVDKSAFPADVEIEYIN